MCADNGLEGKKKKKSPEISTTDPTPADEKNTYR